MVLQSMVPKAPPAYLAMRSHAPHPPPPGHLAVLKDSHWSKNRLSLGGTAQLKGQMTTENRLQRTPGASGTPHGNPPTTQDDLVHWDAEW